MKNVEIKFNVSVEEIENAIKGIKEITPYTSELLRNINYEGLGKEDSKEFTNHMKIAVNAMEILKNMKKGIESKEIANISYKDALEEEKNKAKDMERTIKLLSQHIRDLKMSLREYAPKESTYYLGYDEIQKKLDVLNSIEVNETDSDGDGMIYAMVDNTEENIEKLHSIGFTDDDIAESCGASSLDEIDREQDLDICMLAFRYADFYWYGKFIQSEDIPE